MSSTTRIAPEQIVEIDMAERDTVTRPRPDRRRRNGEGFNAGCATESECGGVVPDALLPALR